MAHSIFVSAFPLTAVSFARLDHSDLLHEWQILAALRSETIPRHSWHLVSKESGTLAVFLADVVEDAIVVDNHNLPSTDQSQRLLDIVNTYLGNHGSITDVLIVPIPPQLMRLPILYLLST